MKGKMGEYNLIYLILNQTCYYRLNCIRETNCIISSVSLLSLARCNFTKVSDTTPELYKHPI